MNEIHHRVEELLPWMVNGTLSGSDRELVQTHVSECLPCRRALKAERALGRAVRSLELPSRESEGLDQLLRTIDRREHTGLSATRIPALAGRPMQFAAAAAVALAAVGVWFAQAPGNALDGAPYATLTAPADVPAHRIDVIFEAGTTAAQIGEIAAALNGQIVTGPSEVGRYTLELDPSADIDRVLDDLPAHPRIRFAGRSFIADSPQ